MKQHGMIYKEKQMKLIHGNCLEKMKDIESGSVDMILTDLPYGTTRNSWDTVIPFEPMWGQYNRVIKSNGAIVLFAQTPFDKILGASNIGMLKYEWIWEKNKATGHLNAKKMPMKAHENILVFYKQLPVYNPQGLIEKKKPTINKGNRGTKTGGAGGSNYGISNKDAVQTHTGYPRDIIYFAVDSKAEFHPTQKPVTLLEYLIKTYTNEEETVLDSCMGSGSTGVACKNLGRHFIGIEMDDKYFEIAEDRIKRVLDGK